MPVLKNISLLATCRDEGAQDNLHAIDHAAVAWNGDKITWVGSQTELPAKYAKEKVYDAHGMMVIPGLVDCHTHLAFGGWRPDEFEMRLRGKSYLEIAKAGGGILSTVQATREATEEELYLKTKGFSRKMLKLGVTAVECKSGYGLSLEHELKLLRVYKRLAEEQPPHIVSTFLGAHTVPPEYKNKRETYIKLITEKMIPAVVKEDLAEFCDIFVEDSAFSIEEAREILVHAKAAGLELKLHADQLTSCGGAELAGELEAASADHLEKISEEGIAAMAQAGVIGVTLPLASLYTQQHPLNCRKLIEGGVPVAVATDFNPGSAPSYDLPLAMMLACNQGGLTPAEAIKGATIYAARAIRRNREIGSIEPGKSADFAVIDAPDPNFWLYHFRPNACRQVFLRGEKVV